MKTSKCEICDAQKEEESPAAGHKPQNVWISDEDHKHHYQECQICQDRLEDTYGEHHYVPYGDDWQCSVCGQIHGFDCNGTLMPDASRSTCSHLIGYCSDCGLELEKFGSAGEFTDYHTFSAGVCTVCSTPDPNYKPPTDPGQNPGGEDGGSGGDGDGGDPGGGSGEDDNPGGGSAGDDNPGGEDPGGDL